MLRWECPSKNKPSKKHPISSIQDLVLWKKKDFCQFNAIGSDLPLESSPHVKARRGKFSNPIIEKENFFLKELHITDLSLKAFPLIESWFETALLVGYTYYPVNHAEWPLGRVFFSEGLFSLIENTLILLQLCTYNTLEKLRGGGRAASRLGIW